MFFPTFFLALPFPLPHLANPRGRVQGDFLLAYRCRTPKRLFIRALVAELPFVFNRCDRNGTQVDV